MANALDTQAAQIATLAEFIPYAVDHAIECHGLANFTTTGVQIVPGWQEWSLQINGVDADNNDLTLTYNAADAEGFLGDINS